MADFGKILANQSVVEEKLWSIIFKIEFRYYEPLAVGHGNPSADFAKKTGVGASVVVPQHHKERKIGS